ncbi:endolytic transglycosylase MltG [Metabacillus arenae]|uniref:Endolytic murein transglycosylase n=1 Tax=Metabacillus arenae TaxID=2771434 RepID=A0A926NEJ6_9BACI|nr:endolytic transglycosylase MltG [Metabacillus arenae]MBD1382049.1 endolytic transglycosylase MltG [Metabacillus arenae]
MSDSKKDSIHTKLLQQHTEAKVVRKIVLTVFISLIIIFSGVIGGGYLYIKSALKPVNPKNTDPVMVEIPIGSSVSSIAGILEDNGLIKNKHIFKYYVKFKSESGFQAGEYQLNQAMDFQEMIDLMKTGKVSENVTFQITIPEGRQLSEIAALIAKSAPYSEKEVLNKLQDKKFIDYLKKKYPDTLTNEIDKKHIKYALEGYLYPATYPFYEKKPSLEDIIEPMVQQTNKMVLNYLPKIEEKKMNVHQFLTMASLIEEEATEKADRDKISSVFYNRIEEGMPLQTDPTVLYALGEHKDRVLYDDLEVDSLYNTYKNTGLPPGPIANAGESSFAAALEPENTDFLYFLATRKGEVIFTKTLKEHNKEKAKHITKQNK